MVRSHITFVSVCALVAVSAVAFAQTPADIECRKTETQAECHARLSCKADEELQDCQGRLLKCKANETLDACKKRAGSEPKKQPNTGQQPDDPNRQGGDRDPNRQGGDRDPNRQGGDRDANETGRDRDPDNDAGERRGRDRGGDGDDGANRRRGGDRGGERQGGRRRAGARSKGFQANKKFGLGLELGEPSGLTGKYFLSENKALDFGIGWIYSHYYYGDGLHLYGDFLWHPTSLVSAAAFELPFFIGVGLRFWDFNYCDNRVCGYDGSAIGLRIPIGIAFDFNNVPLDIFIQAVPVIDFVNGDYYNRYRDRAHFGVDFSVGLRYWFK